MGSEVGTVLDGQTFDFFPPRDRWVEPVPTRSREIENSPQLEYTPAPGFEPGSPDWEAGMLSTTPPRAPCYSLVTGRVGVDSPASRSASLFSAVFNWPTR